MKLYDHVAQHGVRHLKPGDTWEHSRPQVAALKPTVVDVTNVADYLARVHGHLTERDVPTVAPPWPVTWFEYTEPRHVKEGAGTAQNDFAGDQLACRQITIDLQSGAWWVANSVYWRLHDGPGDNPAVAVGTFAYVVLPDGSILQGVDEPVPAAVATPEEHAYIAERAGMPVSGGLTQSFTAGTQREDARISQMKRVMIGAAQVVWLATAFAHCKNVSMVEHATPPKVAAKRAKAGKPVGVTYKTLVIDGMKETLRTEGGIAQNGLKKALHICRGHFATYTADKPLFGKVVGTVWKPMHTRGTKERGEVKKGYKVVAGKGTA